MGNRKVEELVKGVGKGGEHHPEFEDLARNIEDGIRLSETCNPDRIILLVDSIAELVKDRGRITYVDARLNAVFDALVVVEVKGGYRAMVGDYAVDLGAFSEGRFRIVKDA